MARRGRKFSVTATFALLIFAAIVFAVLLVSFWQRWRSARAMKNAQLAAELQGHRVNAGDHRRRAGSLAAKAAELQAQAEAEASEAYAHEERAERSAKKISRGGRTTFAIHSR
jgi:hypothetical protein